MDGNPHLAIRYILMGKILNACVGWLVYGLEGLRYEELTMHVCRMCKLAFVTLARVGKWST